MASPTSVADCRVVEKRTGVQQPNVHWGDGLERDVHTFANLRMPLNEDGNHASSMRSVATPTVTAPATASSASRRTAATGRRSIRLGFLPEFRARRHRLLGGRRHSTHAAGSGRRTSGCVIWLQQLRLQPAQHAQLVARSEPDARRPRRVPTACCGTADDPGIPNQTSFDAGRAEARRVQLRGQPLASRWTSNFPEPGERGRRCRVPSGEL